MPQRYAVRARVAIAGSGAEFIVESPSELAARVAEVGQRFARVAAG